MELSWGPGQVLLVGGVEAEWEEGLLGEVTLHTQDW